MSEKIILIKKSIDELVRAGWNEPVLVPLKEDIDKIPDCEIVCTLTWTEKALRTFKQNKALYKYFQLLADAFTDMGLDVQKVMAFKEVSLPWSKDRVKDLLWFPIQEAMFNTTSTTELETDHVSKVHDVLNRHTSDLMGVSVPFPDKRMQEYEEMSNRY